MQAMNRRRFLGTGALLVGATATSSSGQSATMNRGCIRLLPVEGVTYSDSFLRFIDRARFDSIRDALHSIRDRSIPVRIAHIAAIEPPAH